MFRDFFERHSALDLITLSQSQSMEEFIGNLKGSVYYGPVVPDAAERQGNPSGL